MTSEIKQRIEQINNGQVSEGYKETEFGIFPSDWVTDKKLKDIGSFDKGRGLPGDKMCDSGVPCVGYGDIYMKYNNFHFEKAENFVDEETASESLPIKKGTLLFTGTGETAEEIGKCVCYNGDETIYAGGDIITFKTNEVNPLFLAYQQYQSYSLAKKASFGQGHSVVHIHADNLEKLNVAYPKSTAEQEKIAEILMKWDEAIVLYDRQIEKLKRLKLVCIKKMFPKKRSKVPEVRFKGFTKDWEQRKLGELGTITTGNTPSTSIPDYYSDDGIVWVTPTDICENITFESARKLSDLGQQVGRVVPKNTILVTCIASIGKNTMLGNTGSFNQQINGLTPNENKYDPYFLLTESALWSAKMKGSAASGTMQIVNRTEFSELKTWLPSLIEQQAIGAFFKQLDNLITLHQRKVEKIKTQRKALQQYLLNGIVRVEV